MLDGFVFRREIANERAFARPDGDALVGSEEYVFAAGIERRRIGEVAGDLRKGDGQAGSALDDHRRLFLERDDQARGVAARRNIPDAPPGLFDVG